MEIRFCECGVPVPHFRIYDGELYSRPFCSQEAVMRILSVKLFYFLDRREEPTLYMPEDSRECLRVVAERLGKLPPDKRMLYLDVLKMLANPRLPLTDQEAWDALPEKVKAPIRAMPDFQPILGRTSPRDMPGAFGTLWDWASIDGRNKPDIERCNIYTMLYGQRNTKGTLLR